MSVQRETLDRIKGARAWKDAAIRSEVQEEAMAARPPSDMGPSNKGTATRKLQSGTESP